MSAGPPPLPTRQDSKACPFCAETIKFAAIKCRFCGSDLRPAGARPIATHPAPPPHPAPSAAPEKKLSPRAITGIIICILGGIMTAGAPGMAAVQLGALARTLNEKTGGESYIILACGLLSALIASLSFAVRRPITAYAIITAVIAGGLTYWYQFQVTEQISGVSLGGVSATTGPAFGVAFVGSALVIVGALVSAEYTRPPKTQPKPPLKKAG